MKCLIWLSSLFVLVVFSLCLTGCFGYFEGTITEAVPNPNDVIYLELGDTQSFSVDGSTPSGDDGFHWGISIGPYGGGSFGTGKNVEFVANAQTAWNKMTIYCGMKYYYLGFGCNPFNGECDWFVTWAWRSARHWDIIVTQEPPIWYGSYYIKNNSDAEKLRGFTEVTGDLWVKGNVFLNSLEPLTSLTLVGGNLYVGRHPIDQLVYIYNYSLTTLDGLGSLSSIGGELIIRENSALRNLTALSSLTSVGGELNIEINDAMITLGMDSLDYVGDDFEIDANPELCTYLAEYLRDQVLAGSGIDGYIYIRRNKDCSSQ